MTIVRCCAIAVTVVALFSGTLFGQSNDDSAAKIQAYKLAVQTIAKLNDQLALVQKSIDQAADKVKKLQEQVDSGITSSKTLLEMYRKQLDSLEESKDQADAKLKELQGIVDQLKKDPDVGPEVSADEGLRDMSGKLKQASDILQKAP